MTMAVKLHNKGQRTIHIDGFEFKPDTVVSFPEDKAEKLLGLFVGEVFDIERATEVFNEAEAFKGIEETEEVSEEKRGRGRPPKAV